MTPTGRRPAWAGLERLPAMALGAAAAAVLATTGMAGAETVSVSGLKERTHIHGLAVDRLDPKHLLVATHHGLFRAAPDGKAERISVVQDFMGFTADPADPAGLLASGHPAKGGNLGFIVSADNGVTWRQVSPGVDGPVDFHQMTASAAVPGVIYGAYGALQASRDAGKTWSVVGPLPDKLIDLAASATDADVLYAATQRGLFTSPDGGRAWEPVMEGAPVSLVETAGDTLYAFVVGRGLVRSVVGQPGFTDIGSGWDDRIVLHLAADPEDPDRIYVATREGDILASADGGATWGPMGR